MAVPSEVKRHIRKHSSEGTSDVSRDPPCMPALQQDQVLL